MKSCASRVLIAGIVIACIIVGWQKLTHNAQTQQDTPLIELSNGGFVQKSVTIPQAENIYVRNTSTMALTLCLGHDQQCDPSATLPGYLVAPGITIKPAHIVAMNFTNASNYTITLRGPAGKTSTTFNLLVKVQAMDTKTRIDRGIGGVSGGSTIPSDTSDSDNSVQNSKNSSSSSVQNGNNNGGTDEDVTTSVGNGDDGSSGGSSAGGDDGGSSGGGNSGGGGAGGGGGGGGGD